ncbi:MAG: hypothetical protein IPJ81_02850 [Chitinophagaceae bacterium]|nr:hypothetical protein [Chitinophagaceae bacterium]
MKQLFTKQMTFEELQTVKGGHVQPGFWIREIGPIGTSGFVGMYFWNPVSGEFKGLAGNRLDCVNGTLQ